MKEKLHTRILIPSIFVNYHYEYQMGQLKLEELNSILTLGQNPLFQVILVIQQKRHHNNNNNHNSTPISNHYLILEDNGDGDNTADTNNSW